MTWWFDIHSVFTVQIIPAPLIGVKLLAFYSPRNKTITKTKTIRYGKFMKKDYMEKAVQRRKIAYKLK